MRLRRADSTPPATLGGDAGFGLIWSGFLALVVAAPWLRPGFLFGTDWPGPRRFDPPTELSSSAPVQALLAAASWLLSAELTGKVVVLAILFLAAWLAYRAAPVSEVPARAVAAGVYAVNPFVYGRLMYGQLFLLAAYALLPWVVTRSLRLLERPGPATALLAAVPLVLIGTLSTHLFVMAALLLCALYLGNLARWRGNLAWVAATLGGALLLSGYWIVPLLLGHGPESEIVAQVGPGDLAAYAAVPDHTLGLLPNLLGLYGFWAEDTGRFTSMKAYVPGWPVALVVLLAVCAIGAASNLRRRPAVVALLAAGVLALLLEMGVSHPVTAPVVTWLDQHVPAYRGMRDAGKWGAVIALVYSQLAGLGAAAGLSWLRRRQGSLELRQWAAAIATGLLIALPLYFGNGLLFGAHGAIQPSAYPAGWYSADRVMAADPHPGKALFLPWHEYMSYSFVKNENNVVASPAPSFFSLPIIASTNPEVAGVPPPSDPQQVAMASLLAAGAGGPWQSTLATLDVKYVLVARELDWSDYTYLGPAQGLAQVADFGSIVLYMNTDFAH